MRFIICLLLVVFLSGCHGAPSEQPGAPAVHSTAAPATPDTTARQEPLPRAVAGVSLGMSFAEAETTLGPLTCHDSKAGYGVCNGKEEIGGVSHLELYVHHDHVISLSYEAPAPENAWEFLAQLITRYGRPSLSGVREHDKTGRLHEVYGWKDAESLYSVRLIWKDVEGGGRDMAGTAIALWDRKGYQQWERETRQRETPSAQTDEPPEPT